MTQASWLVMVRIMVNTQAANKLLVFGWPMEERIFLFSIMNNTNGNVKENGKVITKHEFYTFYSLEGIII